MSKAVRPKRAAGRRLRVGIRGLGRAGRALRRSLQIAGYSVVEVPRGSRPSARLDLLVLAVPDDAIAGESRRLARSGAVCRLAMHLSGARDSSALAPLESAGATVFSFHPLRSFSGAPGETLTGCLVAVEGSERGVREARKLARDIGARPRKIDAKAKALYHAAATLAAGGTAALIAAAAHAAASAGIGRTEALGEFSALAISAAENIGRFGFPGGVTGPLARGDRATLRLHRRALATHPELRRVYDDLVRVFRSLISVDRPSGRH